MSGSPYLTFRASPRFKAWLEAEKKRTERSAAELIEEMALLYVLNESRKKGDVTPWPVD